jgi:hypothetical protein
MTSNPVNGNGAYPSEMQEANLFMNALRAAVPTAPDPRVGAVLVPRLAAAARASTLEEETREIRRGARAPAGSARGPRPRLALLARVGIAVALIPLVLAGLAAAGVTVPAPARSVFHAVGIHLPNQPSTVTDRSAGAPGPKQPTQGGKAQGAGTTADEGKSTAAHEHARAQHEKARGKALGHDRGKAVGLNEGTPPGQAKTPPGQTKTPPAQSNAAPGQSKTPPGQSNTPPGQSNEVPGQSKAPPGKSK